MICLMTQSRFCVATLIFYICVLMPLRQLRSALADLMGLASALVPELAAAPESEPRMPVSRFADAQCRGTSECAICLGEFEGEDLVSQLAGCGHVFHVKCIESWLACNNFTCPLCRASFLRNVDAKLHAKNSDHLNPYIPSYLAFSWH